MWVVYGIKIKKVEYWIFIFQGACEGGKVSEHDILLILTPAVSLGPTFETTALSHFATLVKAEANPHAAWT